MIKLNANSAHIDVLRAGTAEINRWANDNPGKSLELPSAHIENSDLSGAILRTANLAGATFHNCILVGAILDNARLTKTHFINCDLRNCSIRLADLTTMRLLNCKLDGSIFSEAHGFSQISGLTTCQVHDKYSDVRFDLKHCRNLDRLLSWSKIRSVGQLRLFLPSYAALIVSIATLTAIGYLNEQLRIIREGSAELARNGVISSDLANRIIEVAHPWHASWRHLAVLASTLGIAMGATLFLLCPSRVKDFTLDQWQYSAQRPSFEYHAETWTLPSTRFCCAVSYAMGGLIAAALLSDTFVRAAVLVLVGLCS